MSYPTSSTPISSPGSPLLGHHHKPVIPRWVKNARSLPTTMPFAGPRYVLKLGVLALVCVMLGWSVSGLHHVGASTALRAKHAGVRPADPGMARFGNDDVLVVGDKFAFDETVDGQRVGYLEEAAAALPYGEAGTKSHVGGEASNPASNDEKGKYSASAGSMFSDLSHKLSSLNPWRKTTSTSFSSDDDTLDRLHAANTDKPTSEHYTPATTPTGDVPLLAKISIVTGNDNSNYERALRTHTAHNRQHGYPMYVLRQSILNDVWSKPAYILSVMLRELAKPRDERLQWLFWVDADTIIINPNVPAEVFLPPVGFDDVHLLVSHDFNGLNNGVFPIRVHPWSVELLSAVIAFPALMPDVNLLFRDQSAMGELLKLPKFSRHSMQAPQRWFNAYQGEVNETIAPFQTRPGDLLVHFAGVPIRDERMEWWLRRVELHLPEWEIEFRHTTYLTETREFWGEMERNRYGAKQQAKKMKEQADDLRTLLEETVQKYNQQLTEEEKEQISKALERARKLFEEDDTKENIEELRAGIVKLKEDTKVVQNMLDKENKALITEARNALLLAESVLLSTEGIQGVEDEVKVLEDIVGHLKETLLGKYIKPDALSMELQLLHEKQEELETKIASIRAENGRLKPDTPEVVDATNTVEEGTPNMTEGPHYVIVWETVTPDAPPPA